MHLHLITIRQAVAIGIRLRGVCVVFKFLGIGEPVVVGVIGSRLRQVAKELQFPGVGQAVIVGIHPRGEALQGGPCRMGLRSDRTGAVIARPSSTTFNSV